MRHQQLQRFCELLQAFVNLAGERDDLLLQGSATPPPLGFTVRLQPPATGSGVEMVLWLRGARLSRCAPGALPLSPDASEGRQFDLDLSAGFRWDCLIFPDAANLARTLVQRMELELSRETGALAVQQSDTRTPYSAG